MRNDTALFEVVLAAHILCAVVGFGSVGVTGAYASLARPWPDHGAVPDSVRRYFRPGPNWASRVMFGVPVFGLILAGMGGGGDLGQPWLWIGSGLWLFAAILAAGVVWPAERRIASIVNEGETASIDEPARRASRAAGAVDIAVVAAFVVMLARLGG